MTTAQDTSANTLPSGLKPLKMTCTSTDCENGLHFFRPKKMVRGACRKCGIELIDWDRVTKRDLSDAAHTFESLRRERIRHHFWHVNIDQKALDHARRKGKTGMVPAAERRIRASVAAAVPAFDGRQTPKEGNSLYYAQHATATCCRKCIEEWHAIPQGTELSDEQVAYFAQLLLLYVRERLPNLRESPENVPIVRRTGRAVPGNK